ncbi:long-chain fatty acid--CoA ligase [Alloprevotella sp. OH1205_COT-284]|uniref:AMP-dependent synthetase/ligase n=1 Tax=Alloprevotella sp. OH1205_COT-284 TaxID=2491043 RepID=UPI000F5EB433|nr:long-chain fatty acid--CoA ligase [Alloprevotella sp. OH1205_COT-284]RRD79972.1 long-chain fatty acid--CoA ligase [Alloprevotella sp. OH1205_COT-284]
MPILCHLSQLVQKSAARYGDRTAIQYRNYALDRWIPVSWNKFARRVGQVSRSLAALNVGVQENIAIFSQNKPEYLFVEFGAFGMRGAIVPFYATSSGAQVQYMINDASVRILFVGEQQQYDAAWSVISLCHSLEHIIIFDRSVKKSDNDTLSIYFDEFLRLGDEKPDAEEMVRERTENAADEDLAGILYTSGTTGQPKGVMMLHSQYQAALKGHVELLPMGENDITMNFLPFCHVFEGAWTKLCIACGVQLAINLRPLDIQKSMREVRPTLMCAVPRFWEKVYQGVLDKAETAGTVQRALIKDALKTGAEVWERYVSKQQKVPLGLRLKYSAYDKTIIRLLRNTLGLDRANFFPVAGASISNEVERFVHAAGFKMLAGYGLTETCATVSFDHPDRPVSLGSIGRPLPGVEVKIGENNEILVRGNTVTPGYYKKENETKEAFTPDGWLHTGDAGYVKDGELYITERIKDLFKTSNGKYIAPQAIEGRLTIDRHFEQVVVVADKRKFVSALIVPSFPVLESFAQVQGISYGSREELCKDNRVIRYLANHIETLQQDLAAYEKIKRFVLLSEPLTMENGELTNTLKVRRQVVYKNYADEIEQIYLQAEAEQK